MSEGVIIREMKDGKVIRDPTERLPPPPIELNALGLDLGRQQDFSALALLRWPIDPNNPNRRPTYTVPTLTRWPLGTPYRTVAQNVATFLLSPPLADRPCLVVVDATGVGAPVCEMVREEMTRAGVVGGIAAVTITAGSAVTCAGWGQWRVAKKQLVSILQVLLGNRRLKVSDQPEAKNLLEELSTFTVKVTEHANETFESWRERDHDDLVLAIALAAWGAETLDHPGRPS